MKRLWILLIVLMLLLPVGVRGDEQGLLPSLEDAFGVFMPSLGDILHRYPDHETKEADGSIVQQWASITDKEFEAFSEYLVKEGASLVDYTVTDGVFTATVGKAGRTFTFVYNPTEETALITYPLGTCDERSYLAAAHYVRGKEFMANEQYEEAYAEFSSISDYALYKDVGSLMENEKHLKHLLEAKLKPFKTVGSYVTFGSYEQDNNSDNGKEAIEWLVLACDGEKALLLSRYGLDAQPYNKKYVSTTWAKCTLRTWLNGTFLNEAFTAEEQKGILLTNVDNGKSQGYSKWSTSGGNNTQDRVFLLSYAEANKYLGVKYNDSNNTKSRVAPTAYAIKQGAYTSSSNQTADGSAAGWWWLRSPGYNQSNAAGVRADGSLYSSSVNSGSGCVRPALWLNLDSGIF